MRPFITLAVALLVAGSAHAAPSMDPHDICNDYYLFAERVMQGRQVGYPLPDMLSHVEGQQGQPHLEEIIVWAYDEPRYETREFRLEAVSEFANEVMRDCLRTKRAASRAQ
ncbi:hypothetical protein [Halomonas heilongjiangensis]|uniref:Uncharacterized protein n=1 Tax=Halomonas heilongjiangensis TaxID=1387883 RepID=A0A2N7TU58_9GAMM|nr:hypothetical protein [Halomonas heilongjiangensis]PMR71722.1 hypothetical protein C1H66_01405 [Halomonas heilongjiangensis]PXX89998.1 hypothetical protein CR158_10480 [Halomonas heilongjiangensis]